MREAEGQVETLDVYAFRFAQGGLVEAVEQTSVVVETVKSVWRLLFVLPAIGRRRSALRCIERLTRTEALHLSPSSRWRLRRGDAPSLDRRPEPLFLKACYYARSKED